MDAVQGLRTVGFTYKQIGHVEEFCEQCKIAGYKNNESIKAMRLDWCLEKGGQFFLTYLEDKIISLSGCHPLPEAGEGVYRILFRGATLPEYQNLHGVLNKSHMNSIPFYHHVPRQIKWASSVDKYTKFVITTNHVNKDNITSMVKSHRVFKLLEKQNIVSCMHEKLFLFNTDQSVWLLNQLEYNQKRDHFTQRHYV